MRCSVIRQSQQGSSGAKEAGQRRSGTPASTDKGRGKGCTKEVSNQRRRARPEITDKRRPAHSSSVEQSVHIVCNESREGECLDTEEELEGVQQPHREDA